MHRYLNAVCRIAGLFLILLATGCGLVETPSGSATAGVTPSVARNQKDPKPNVTEDVTAEVILRAADGSSILDVDEGITAENISKYRVGTEVIEQATRTLEELGFDVLEVGPVSLTISGEKTLFESVFQTKLKPYSRDDSGTKVSGTETSYYEITEPIRVPDQLSSLVADVALPTPPQYFR